MGKIIVVAVAIAGLTSILWWQHASNDNLRRENDALKRALMELKPSQDVSEPDASVESLTQEQMDELLKLRGEVTQLREQTNQIGDLADVNKKLMGALREAKFSQRASGGDAKRKNDPPDALPQDIHPKDSWAFRGYGSPEATLESTLWSMLQGDKATALAAFSPEMRPKMEKQLEGKDFAEEVNKIKMSEFRILDRRQISDDEMVLKIYTARETADGDTLGSSEKTVFQRIGGEWKVTDKQAPDD
ncbi:MAG TPA: hypothetical protein VHC44_16285 [Verrucomicrobiae bacterium]|nr:hypothetical protein [Verrucomicrobiae bacterium]